MEVLLFLYFVLHSVLSTSTVNSDSNFLTEEMIKISKSQNAFAKNLYLNVTKNSNGNLFFSPFGIAAALSMVFLGSKGNTDNEIKLVFNFPCEKSTLKKGYHNLFTALREEKSDFDLNSANMVYVSKDYSVLEEFSASISDDILGSVTSVDFTATENARMEINRAVEKETRSRIRDLIPPDYLSDMTRLVLINAIYFKGLWSHPFKTSDTEIKPFWITEYKSVGVPMMTTKNYYRMERNYDLNYRILALDYLGDRLKFLILLPDEIDGLKKIEANLLDEEFQFLNADSTKIDIKVSIPKFTIEETIDLVTTLESMGISDLFSEERCDLSGVSGQKDLFVSKALHKAFIEIDEEGTEAAAATASNIRLKRSLEMPETFVADRPFVFLIYDKTLEMILFMGRFVTPLSKRASTDEL